MTKTYAIADLHGRLDLLLAAYNALTRDHEPGLIIHLGDYIDRGPDSKSVVEVLMSEDVIPRGFRRIILKGNHEDMMVRTLKKPLSPEWWIGNGGSSTLESYGHKRISVAYGSSSVRIRPYYRPDCVPAEHVDFLEGLPWMHFDEHRVFVHAGVDPTKPLAVQDPDILTWKIYPKDDQGGHGDRHVVHGHHQRTHGPEKFSGRTNLDTGAYYTGRLVVGVFDEVTPGGPIDIIEVKA